MKYFFSIVLMNVIVSANSQALLNDTAYVKLDPASIFQIVSATNFTATGQCSVNTSVTNVPNTPAGRLSSIYDTITYNNDGTVSQSVEKFSYSNPASYVNASRQSFTYYNATKKFSSHLIQSWINSTWQDSILISNLYDSKDSLTSTTTQNWDKVTNHWVNKSQTLFTNDGNGYHIEELAQIWDTLTNNWVNKTKHIYTNNSKGKPVINQIQSFKNNIFVIAQQVLSSYDVSDTLRLSSLTQAYLSPGQWLNAGRDTIIYNSSGQPLKMISEIFLQQWVTTQITTYSYNSDGTIRDQLTELVLYTYVATKNVYQWTACNSSNNGTYITISNGDWNNPATWQGGIVPPATAAVVIKNSVALTSDITCKTITVKSPGSLDIHSGIKLRVTN